MSTMRETRFGLLGKMGLGIFIFIFIAAARGELQDIQLDTALFGNLKQENTGPINCGPTAKTNSMAYLQRKFGVKLIPRQTRDWNHDGQPDDLNGDGVADFYDDMMAVAGTLSDTDYMNVNVDDNGCTYENFVYGQDKFLTGKGVTYQGRYFQAWNVNHQMTRPGTITENTYPDLEYLHSQLAKGCDVEILIDNASYTEGHYLTLTSLKPGSNKIDYIDPRTGTKLESDIVSTADGKLVFTYSYTDINGQSHTFDATVLAAVSEIPEPGTLTVVLLAALASMTRRGGWAALRHGRGESEPGRLGKSCGSI